MTCEQACVTYEYRPHRLENSAQCGVDTRMNLPGALSDPDYPTTGGWTPWIWEPGVSMKPGKVYVNDVLVREYRAA